MTETEARRRLAALHGKSCCEVCDAERDELWRRRTDFGIFELCDPCYQAVYGPAEFEQAIESRLNARNLIAQMCSPR